MVRWLSMGVVQTFDGEAEPEEPDVLRDIMAKLDDVWKTKTLHNWVDRACSGTALGFSLSTMEKKCKYNGRNVQDTLRAAEEFRYPIFLPGEDPDPDPPKPKTAVTIKMKVKNDDE